MPCKYNWFEHDSTSEPPCTIVDFIGYPTSPHRCTHRECGWYVYQVIHNCNNLLQVEGSEEGDIRFNWILSKLRSAEKERNSNFLHMAVLFVVLWGLAIIVFITFFLGGN